MLKSYAKELSIIGLIFGLMSYTIYVCAQPQKEVVTATRGVKAVKAEKPAPAKAAKPAEAKKEHAKKPKLKAKYADKK